MDICNFMFSLLALILYALTNTATNISRKNITKTRNVTNTGIGDGDQTIFLPPDITLEEICISFNISKIDCTCENFADFVSQEEYLFVADTGTRLKEPSKSLHP